MIDYEPRDLVDLHNHLIPAVDDGTRDVTEALRALYELAAEGLTGLATTPHLNGRLARESPGALQTRLTELTTGFRILRDAATDAGLPIPVFSQEILVPDARTATAVFREPRVGLAATPYALIEFGFELGGDPVSVVHATLDAGRQPIVAHPERYRRDGEVVSIDEIRRWKEAGALLQVNAGSVLGHYGEDVKVLASRIIAAGLADVIGSDHHGDYRPVSLADAGRKLAADGFPEQAKLLLAENPGRVLAGRATLRVPPTVTETAA